jgi:hypothetical protein
MNRFTHTATKLGAAVLVGSYVLTSAAFAAPPIVTISGTAPRSPAIRGIHRAGGVTMGHSIVAAGASRLPCMGYAGNHFSV